MAQSLNSASKKSINSAKVSKLDSFGTSKSKFTKAESFSVIEKILGDFIKRILDNIEKEDMVVTGDITNIQTKTVSDGVIVTAPAHLVYQDRGVNGSVQKKYNTPHSYKDKRPPVDAFIEYIKNNNSIHLMDENYGGEGSKFKELTIDEKITRAAWAMSTKVFKEGFRPRNIYSKEIPKLVEDLKRVFADFSIQYVLQDININPRGGGEKRVIV